MGGNEGGEFGFTIFAVGGEEGGEVGYEGGYVPERLVKDCRVARGFLPSNAGPKSSGIRLVADIGKDQVRVDGDGPCVASELRYLFFPSGFVALELIADYEKARGSRLD